MRHKLFRVWAAPNQGTESGRFPMHLGEYSVTDSGLCTTNHEWSVLSESLLNQLWLAE